MSVVERSLSCQLNAIQDVTAEQLLISLVMYGGTIMLIAVSEDWMKRNRSGFS